jgi:aspartyl protease family protein
MMYRNIKNTTIFIVACAAFTWAAAQPATQSVALSGVMGSKALLVIDGGGPKALGVGETYQGIKLLSVSGDQAVLEVKGTGNATGPARLSVRVGDAPVSQGARPGGSNATKIILPVGQGGHFFAQGWINNRPIQFMVDTGATTVAMGISDAERMGIDYKKGQVVRMGTANGVAQGWKVKVSILKIGDIEVYDVDTIVGPNMPFALLGNSFLSRFNMNKTYDQMVLEKRF